MITVAEAKSIILRNCGVAPSLLAPLAEATGAVLADHVRAPLDLPPFDQSSMDGYAVRFDDLANGRTFPVQGVIPAGKLPPASLEAGKSFRIFTGAAVPEGADTVIMQEQAVVLEAGVEIHADSPEKGMNVRPRGAEIKRGTVALEKGVRLSPSAIGYLAGMGITNVPIYSFPKIALIITGDELVKPGETLQPGQVYESTSLALTAAIKPLAAQLTTVCFVPDDVVALTEAIVSVTANNDIILVTGGVSVGDFDFTAEACRRARIEKQFHRVKQKPGKPLFFGTMDTKLVFGLPGNPSSVLTCFYQYVAPAIDALTGGRPFVKQVTSTFSGTFRKKSGLTHFLKGKFNENSATHSTAQESYRLSSFAVADCLIEVPEATELLQTGDTVTVYLLP